MKIVYLKPRLPGLALHTAYEEMMMNPPEGYRFEVLNGKGRKERDSCKLTNINILEKARYATVVIHNSWLLTQIYSFGAPFIERVISDGVQGSYIDRTLYPVIACQHTLSEKTKCRWIVDAEHASALCSYGRIDLHRSWITKRLKSNFCKAIILWSHKARQNFNKVFGENFDEKIYVLPPTVKIRPFRRNEHEKIRLIHVGTWRNSYPERRVNFIVKGTRETLIIFKKLSEKYRSKIEMIVCSYVPLEWRRALSSYKNIIFINGPIPRENVFKLYAESDIFIMPCHSTPTLAFPEAMSCGLPIVTTRVWANEEFVIDGKTGFLINPPKNVKYEDQNETPLWYHPKFMNSLRTIDNRMIRDFFEAISILIEDDQLRRQMSKESRYRVEEGDLSIAKRNKVLKDILDKLY
jgi:glycosyltransferase involved in cell wall biosynthesis